MKTPDFAVRPLTPERWKDFERLFGANGACAGCWCQWNRQTSAEFRAKRGAANKRLMKRLAGSGEPPGLLAYDGREPVGWIAVGPRSAYRRLETSRVLAPVDGAPVWSAPCFFVAKTARRRGVTAALLQAAAAHARRQGAEILEGYPVETRGKKTAAAFLWWGTASSFRRAGFKEAARRSKSRPVMRLALGAGLLAAVLAPRPAAASCGSASCSVDPVAHEPSEAGRMRLDLSFQYVDQDTPRVHARRANVGQDPNPDHDEVRSINRAWNARLDYDFSPRWGAAVSLPLLARTHDHIDTASGDLARWRSTGVGDLMVETRFAAWRGEGERSPALTLLLTGKFPTGRTGAHNAGDRAEVPIQPGSGSYDVIAGVVYSLTLPKLVEAPRAPAAFAGASYRKNNPGSSGYVVGDVFDGRLGATVPLAARLDAMAQADWRVRRRDQAGQTAEDVTFTGGQSLHLSPGARWYFGKGVSAYGFVQLPVYQYVNREQLTSSANWHGGLSWEFAAPSLPVARDF